MGATDALPRMQTGLDAAESAGECSGAIRRHPAFLLARPVLFPARAACRLSASRVGCTETGSRCVAAAGICPSKFPWCAGAKIMHR